MKKAFYDVAVVLNLNKDFDRKIAKGIAAYAKTNTTWQVYLEDELENRLPLLRKWDGDGLIANLDDTKFYPKLRKLGVPIVGVGGAVAPEHLKITPHAYVTTNNHQIAELAAEHLADLGLGHFAYYGIRGVITDGNVAWSHIREKAFELEIHRRNSHCEKMLAGLQEVQRWSTLQHELAKWISNLPKPVGILACDDPRARHVLLACKSLGLRVPQDVAVLGVDNDEIMCEMIHPSLTSVVQAAERIGFRAAELLNEAMQKRSRALTTDPKFEYCDPLGVSARESTDTLFVKDPIVAACLEYIRTHLKDRFDVRQLAKFSGYSRGMLDIRFRNATGQSTSEAICRIRLAAAKKLLLETDDSQRSIALRIGLSGEEHFSSWFRKLVEKTPGDFRREHRAMGIE